MSIGRLRGAASFQSLLGSRVRERSAHFAVHHAPTRIGEAQAGGSAGKLSTDPDDLSPNPVDESGDRCLLGCILPKRHARRSVMRSVIRRQIKAAMARVEPALEAGAWLVRLRSPLPPAQFRSADSEILRRTLRAELDDLLARCTAPRLPKAAGSRGGGTGRAPRKPESADLPPPG